MPTPNAQGTPVSSPSDRPVPTPDSAAAAATSPPSPVSSSPSPGASYYLLPGSPALSSARTAALLARLRTVDPGLTGLAAAWFYLVRTSRPLDADTMSCDSSPETR